MPAESWVEIAARQHGALSRQQARRGGLSRAAISRRIDRGELVPATPLVLRLAGADPSPDQRLMVAVLDAGPGACICMDSAATSFGIPGYRLEPVHVWRIRDRSNHDERVSIQHKTRSLPTNHVLLLRHIPMTTPARLFVDLAGRLSLERAGRLLDDLWGRNLVNYATADRCIAELSRPGRTGLVNARELLQARGPNYRPPASNLERRVMHLLDEGGYPDFIRQVDVGDDEGWIGRVDFRHAYLPLILEVQSELYHGGLSNEAADRIRLGRMRAVGFVVVELLEFDVWHRPQIVLELVAAGIREAQAAHRLRLG
jgi:hypothetical protein